MNLFDWDSRDRKWYITFLQQNKVKLICPLWQWRSAMAHPADKNVHGLLCQSNKLQLSEPKYQYYLPEAETKAKTNIIQPYKITFKSHINQKSQRHDSYLRSQEDLNIHQHFHHLKKHCTSLGTSCWCRCHNINALSKVSAGLWKAASNGDSLEI